MKNLYIFISIIFCLSTHLIAQYADPTILHLVDNDETVDFYATKIIDIDQDGFEDIVYGSANAAEGKIGIFYGEGNSEFENKADSFLNIQILDIEVGDIDLDGKLDIVALDGNGDKAFWYKNLGTREFSAAQEIVSINASRDIISLVDYNQDGLLDLIGVTYQTIFWCENMGNGVFDENTILIDSIIGITEILAEDMDQDGDMDILPIIDNINTNFAWYKNNAGVLERILVDSQIRRSLSGKLSDFDGDLDLDIVLSTENRNEIIIYENTGLGVFNFTNYYGTDNSTFGGIDDVNVYDVDNDGLNDIVYASGGTIGWLKNTGNLNFGSYINITSNVGFGEESIEFIDLYQDNSKELLIKSNQEKLSLINSDDFSDGNGEVVINEIIDENFGEYLFNQYLVSPNINGYPDIFLMNTDPYGAIQKLENDNTGNFDNISDFYQESNLLFSNKTQFQADLNGDNREDLIYRKSNASFVWIERDENDDFLQKHTVQLDINIVSNLYLFDFADIDDDGDIDILGSTIAVSNGKFFLVILKNNGNGVFDEFVTLQSAIDDNIEPAKFGDFDGDGDFDVIAEFDTSIKMYLNDGAGSFPTTKSIPLPNREGRAPYRTAALNVADIDLDGNHEVFANFWIKVPSNPICGTHCTDIIYPVTAIYDYNGNNLAIMKTYDSHIYNERSIFEDYNRDGNIDLLNLGVSSLSWALGDGLGDFEESVIINDESILGLGGYVNFKTTDVELDGDLDIILLIDDVVTDRVVLLENLEFTSVENDLDNDGVLSDVDCDDSDNSISSILATPDIIKAVSICEGETLNIPISNVNTGLNYIWAGPEDYSSTNSSLQINNINLTQAGIYQTASYNDNCASISAQIEVTVLPVADVTINFESELLEVEGAFLSYQWLLEGISIDGATSSTFQPLESGNYSIIVVNSDGCSATSNVIIVSINNVFSNQLNKGISLYPNPVTTQQSLNVEINTVERAIVFYEIISANGKLVQRGTFTGSLAQIKTDRLARGIYTLKMYSDKQSWVSQFQIQ